MTNWTPPPPPGRALWHRLTSWQQAAVIAGGILALVLAAILIPAAEDDSAAQPTADEAPPAYTVVTEEQHGAQTTITVEVDSLERLRAVFDDVIADLDQDGGYLVQINCTTGGTSAADNRLANGRYALGSTGAAAVGLADGETEFEINQGRSCPAE